MLPVNWVILAEMHLALECGQTGPLNLVHGPVASAETPGQQKKPNL